MAKTMLFIDGTWLYRNVRSLSEQYDRTEGTGETARYQIDYGRLPFVVADKVKSQMERVHLDIVRTYFFGSYANNVHQVDGSYDVRRLAFYASLKQDYNYEVECFPIDFRGRRLRKADRDPRDDFEPKEKQVDVALATTMLYLAAIPYAYDIAIAIVGDGDYIPVFQHVRRLGKRVAIASIKEHCPGEFIDPTDKSRVKDFSIIWINDLLDKLQLKVEQRDLECQNRAHPSDMPRKQLTSVFLRGGQKFYCNFCREQHRLSKREAYVAPIYSMQQTITAVVYKMVEKKQSVWARTADNEEYCIHENEFSPRLLLQDITEGTFLEFEVYLAPTKEKGGRARRGSVHLVPPVDSVSTASSAQQLRDV